MADQAIIIRPYEDDDEAEVSQLWREVFPHDPPWNEPRAVIHRKMLVQRELFLVGDVEGLVIATVMAGFDGHRGWIHRVAVASTFRHHGYGSAMMHAAEQRLRQIGCTKVNLQVRVGNDEVIAFYRKLGYDVEPRIAMGKRLE